MDEIILNILIMLLTITFLCAAILLRRTRTRIENKTMKNTATMLHVRDIIQGKIRKFKR